MTTLDIDARVRIAAFEFLGEQVLLHGEVLPRTILAQGFQFGEVRVPLIGPQGIFKPAVLPDVPLSITTVPVVEGRQRPYEDEVSSDGFLLYRYRGVDPDHRDNVGLRLAMQRRTPLVYFYGVVPGEYMPVWPVYVVADDPAGLAFSIAVDERRSSAISWPSTDSVVTDIRRAYVTRVTLQRLHQQTFRERVLRAYQERCAVCRLRHDELLEAAHILPDGHPEGEPIVPNGLALCKLHHAAFDRHILGIRPDLTVELRRDVLHEADGPMLVHGLQSFQGVSIQVPRHPDLRPKARFLGERYALFLKAG